MFDRRVHLNRALFFFNNDVYISIVLPCSTTLNKIYNRHNDVSHVSNKVTDDNVTIKRERARENEYRGLEYCE